MWDIDSIIAANKARGFHFFDPSTIRFFRSRVSGVVFQGIGGVLFVTSEAGPDSVRAYSVREFHPDSGVVETCKRAGEFQEFRTIAQAQARARHVAECAA